MASEDEQNLFPEDYDRYKEQRDERGLRFEASPDNRLQDALDRLIERHRPTEEDDDE